MNDYVSILNLIQTKQQATSLKFALEDIQGKLFRSKDFSKLFAVLPIQTGEELEKILRKRNVSHSDSRKIQEILEEIIASIDKMSVLSLEVAFEPTGRTVEKINSWLKENIKSQVLLDFIVNTSLIAGSRIYFEGKVGDYSLRKQFEDRL